MCHLLMFNAAFFPLLIHVKTYTNTEEEEKKKDERSCMKLVHLLIIRI